MEAGLSVQHTMRLDELPIGPWPGLGVLATYAGFALVSGLTLFHLATREGRHRHGVTDTRRRSAPAKADL